MDSGSYEKSAMEIERKEDKRTMALHTSCSERSERRRRALNEGKMDHFITGDIDSILIEGTIIVLNFQGRGWFFGRGVVSISTTVCLWILRM